MGAQRLWILPSLALWSSMAFAAPARPRVDRQAMTEAMRAVADESYFGSSASYAHFLRARLEHQKGDHRRALRELRLALASDDGSPYLLTAIAEQYVRLGDLVRAERELRKVIETNASYYAAQLLMGRVLYEAHKLTRARVHLKRAIELSPKSIDPYMVLAQLWLELGQTDEAVKVIEQLGAALPGEPTGYKRLGLALAERGETKHSERLLEHAHERDQGDFETLVALAQLREHAGKLKEALEGYERALGRDPWSREVLLSAGRTALRLEDPKKARGYFDRLLQQERDPELAVRIAFSYLSMRRVADAAEVLESARTAGLGEPRLHFYAGLVHEKLRRYQNAAVAFEAVGREAGELFHESRLHRATCLSLAGQHRVALQLFRAGAEERPDYTSLHVAHARALERAGRAEDAEALLTLRLEQSFDGELFDALTGLLERQGRLAEAIEKILSALEKRPRDEALLFSLGAAYERKGDLARALSQMRALLSVNPDNALALNFTGYLLADRNLDLNEAERMLNRALELKPGTGAFLDSLGWLYYRKGELARAVSTLEQAAALSPDEPTIQEHLGDAYHRLSRQRDAAEAYQNALEAMRHQPELAESQGQKAAIERKLKMLSSPRPGR